MPKSVEIKKVLVIGSGPAVIGQAGEFDYAGLQACRVLRKEGRQVVVVNSNPASMVTDPETAESVYCEPLTKNNIERIIVAERPDALLAQFGGQTALNIGASLAGEGILDKYQVKLLGVDGETISRSEDRKKFKEVILAAGLKVPSGGVAENVKDGVEIGQNIGFPVIIRASYALEGAGVWVAYNQEELVDFLEKGLKFSPVRQVSVEESLLGWKELEFEVIRDHAFHFAMVASMENIDPVGVHTGDSAVVAPVRSLTAGELQNFADLCGKVARVVGVVGGASIQFAQNPVNGEVMVLEVNPRFTRSSALATQITGFPVARVTAFLALGYTLEEVMKMNPSSGYLEPAVDYIALKLPRFNFEKFPTADPVLTTSMKSVGETVAVGRNFKEALQKGLRSLEIGRHGLGADGRSTEELSFQEIKQKIVNPNPERIFYLSYALKRGISIEEVGSLSGIDLWFLKELAELVSFEKELTTYALYNLPKEIVQKAKIWGFSDCQLAFLLRTTEDEVRKTRQKFGINVHYGRIEPCGGDNQPGNLFYSTYDLAPEENPAAGEQPKVIVLGSGPNRIEWGSEFNYCSAHAVLGVSTLGYESIMIDNNPASVSTGAGIATRIYLEPLTREDILNIVEREKPLGIILQFNGRTSPEFVNSLEKAGVKILGTSFTNTERVRDQEQFKELLKKLGLMQPGTGKAMEFKTALETARQISYPVIVQSDYSGSFTETIYQPEELQGYLAKLGEVSSKYPVRISKILDNAIGVEVDCVADPQEVVVCGMIERIEEARIHPGDSAGSLPPYTLGNELITRLKEITRLLAVELGVTGMMNVQFAVKYDQIYVLGVQLSAGRTVPFISKATGVSWAAVAAKAIMGNSLQSQEIGAEFKPNATAIREVVFPFARFPGIDPILGPEMRSTGEVIGLDRGFGPAFIKSQIAAGENIPTGGAVFISIRDEDKRVFASIARQLVELGFKIMATEGTARMLSKNSIPCQSVFKVGEGRPNILDKIKNGEIQWIINTPSDHQSKRDEILMRSTAAGRGIPITTTVSGAQAAAAGLVEYLKNGTGVKLVKEYY